MMMGRSMRGWLSLVVGALVGGVAAGSEESSIFDLSFEAFWTEDRDWMSYGLVTIPTSRDNQAFADSDFGVESGDVVLNYSGNGGATSSIERSPVMRPAEMSTIDGAPNALLLKLQEAKARILNDYGKSFAARERLGVKLSPQGKKGREGIVSAVSVDELISILEDKSGNIGEVLRVDVNAKGFPLTFRYGSEEVGDSLSRGQKSRALVRMPMMARDVTFAFHQAATATAPQAGEHVPPSQRKEPAQAEKGFFARYWWIFLAMFMVVQMLGQDQPIPPGEDGQGHQQTRPPQQTSQPSTR